MYLSVHSFTGKMDESLERYNDCVPTMTMPSTPSSPSPEPKHPPSESTALISTAGQDHHEVDPLKVRSNAPALWIVAFTSVILLSTLATTVPWCLFCDEPEEASLRLDAIATNTMTMNTLSAFQNDSSQSPSSSSLSSSFPSDFVWGTATSSYQIEGGVASRGRSIWDVFCHDDTAPDHIWNHSNADVACDHYHLFRQDVQLLSDLGIPHYRFSISWPRIFPKGTTDVINQPGIDFYNQLINTLLAHNITPWITLYHWDLPQALQEQYGGWLGRDTVHAFGEYARFCFAAFGDRVQHWITINEAWSVAVLGYNNGVHAPGHSHHPSTEPYLVGHHLLLAHATAAHIYHTEFASQQHGSIGMSNCGDYRYPKDASRRQDQEAAQRAMLFQMGWFTDPLVLGDYPKEMRDILGDRLPQFTTEERELLASSTQRPVDFIGLNHYSSIVASNPPPTKPTFGGYWADINVDFSNHPSWKQSSMGWNVVPQGCRDMLLWIAQRYPNISIYITENGTSDDDDDSTLGYHRISSVSRSNPLYDINRITYLRGYLHALKDAVELGVPVGGYFVWSLMDNFEWQYGYQRKFGIVQVDFGAQMLQRTPKASAIFYRNVIGKANEVVA